jgi:hypothetical protein
MAYPVSAKDEPSTALVISADTADDSMELRRDFLERLGHTLVADGFSAVNANALAQLRLDPEQSPRAIEIPIVSELADHNDRIFFRLTEGGLNALEILLFRFTATMPADVLTDVWQKYNATRTEASKICTTRNALLFMTFYIVHEKRLSIADKHKYKKLIGEIRRKVGYRTRRRRGGSFLSEYPSVVTIDLLVGDVHGRPFSDVDKIVSQAAKAAVRTEHSTQKASDSLLTDFFTKPLQALSFIWRHFIFAAYAPDLLAYKIFAGEIKSGDLSTAFASSILLTISLDKCFGMNSVFEPTNIGFIDEILQAAIFLTIWAASTSLVYLPLKLLGGRANFRQTFYVTIYVSVIMLPATTLIFNIGESVGIPAQQLTGLSSAAFYFSLPVYAVLHGISYWKAFWAINLFQMAALAVLGIGIIGALAMLSSMVS